MSNRIDSSIRVIEIEERDWRIFPREELISSDGQTLILPETWELGALDFREVVTGIKLRTLGLVGYLPLTKKIALNIRPKFSVANLWHLLKYADESYSRVLTASRTYQRGEYQAPHLLLVRSFCCYLKSILTSGIAKGYIPDTHDGYYKPKINFGRTTARYLSRGNLARTSSDVFVFSVALKVNGLLKSACQAFLKITPRDEDWQSDRALLLEALSVLERATSAEMQPDHLGLTKSLPIWIRDEYESALWVYSLYLGHHKIGFAYDSEGWEMPSFLLSLDFIFESFIRNITREALAVQGIGVMDGNKNLHPLFVDNKTFPTKPDLVFKKRKLSLGLAEVKYKPKIEEADRYQLISHTIARNVPIGIWISPSPDDREGMEYIGAIHPGAKFYHYRINLSNDLHAASRRMTDAIALLLSN